MFRHAEAQIGEEDLTMRELGSLHEMDRQREIVALLRARMAKPATEEEESEWREFQQELEKERLTFR